jgi:hypothetical protein
MGKAVGIVGLSSKEIHNDYALRRPVICMSESITQIDSRNHAWKAGNPNVRPTALSHQLVSRQDMLGLIPSNKPYRTHFV